MLWWRLCRDCGYRPCESLWFTSTSCWLIDLWSRETGSKAHFSSVIFVRCIRGLLWSAWIMGTRELGHKEIAIVAKLSIRVFVEGLFFTAETVVLWICSRFLHEVKCTEELLCLHHEDGECDKKDWFGYHWWLLWYEYKVAYHGMLRSLLILSNYSL